MASRWPSIVERVDHVRIDRAPVRPALGLLGHIAQRAHPRQLAEPFRQAPTEVGRVAAGKRGQELVVQRVVGDVLHVDLDVGMRLLVGGDLLLGGDPVRLLRIPGDPEMQVSRDRRRSRERRSRTRRQAPPRQALSSTSVIGTSSSTGFFESRAAVEDGREPLVRRSPDFRRSVLRSPTRARAQLLDRANRAARGALLLGFPRRR